MTTRQAGDTLYIVMDFEGLGTKNSPEEDTLLSVVNAAISNITTYKCGSEFRLFLRCSLTVLVAFSLVGMSEEKF